jgi:hypothetical protein
MPNTIADNLARLQTARTDIANAITTKGGTVTSGDGFEDFPAEILGIPAGAQEIDGTFTRDSNLPSGWGLTVSTVQQQGKYVKIVGTIKNSSSSSRTLNASTVIGQVSNLELQGFSQSNITKWFNSGYTGIDVDCSNITSTGFTITSGVSSVTFAAKTPKDICVVLQFENS